MDTHGWMDIYQAKVIHKDTFYALGCPSNTWAWKTGYFTTRREAVLDSLRHWRSEFKEIINVDCNGCIDRMVAAGPLDHRSVPKCSDPPCSERTQGGLEYAREVMGKLFDNEPYKYYCGGESTMKAFFGTKLGYNNEYEFSIEEYKLLEDNKDGDYLEEERDYY